MSTVKLTYFPVWAKGPSIALALEHSGIPWEGAFPGDWPTLKPQTPWLELPILEIPSVGKIGHEMAILNWIGMKNPAMAGNGEAEFVVSQQLAQEAEDIYKKLGAIKTNQISAEDKASFWGGSAPNVHNRDFGVNVYLMVLERLYKKCGAGDGKFTSSGITVGECKLFAVLHALKMIKDDVLAQHPGMVAFYTRFAGEAATQSVMTTGAKMPGPFNQYFTE